MSMNSRLTRGKNGELLLDGKPHSIGLDTGDDTPVKVDEREDVDLNKLVTNEMARQELLKIPGDHDYQDLTDYPRSRGEAQARLSMHIENIKPYMKDGESYEQAMQRFLIETAQAQAKIREQNAKQAGSQASTMNPAAASAPNAAPSVPGPDSGPSKA